MESKVQMVKEITRVKHNGRTYQICRESVTSSGDEYISIKLYNSSGKFIKRFMVEPDIAAEIAFGLIEAAPLPFDKLVARFPTLFFDEEVKR